LERHSRIGLDNGWPLGLEWAANAMWPSGSAILRLGSKREQSPTHLHSHACLDLSGMHRRAASGFGAAGCLHRRCRQRRTHRRRISRVLRLRCSRFHLQGRKACAAHVELQRQSENSATVAMGALDRSSRRVARAESLHRNLGSRIFTIRIQPVRRFTRASHHAYRFHPARRGGGVERGNVDRCGARPVVESAT
jgi:hypothetical protein